MARVPATPKNRTDTLHSEETCDRRLRVQLPLNWSDQVTITLPLSVRTSMRLPPPFIF